MARQNAWKGKYQKQSFRGVFKKVVLRNFTKFTGKKPVPESLF